MCEQKNFQSDHKTMLKEKRIKLFWPWNSLLILIIFIFDELNIEKIFFKVLVFENDFRKQCCYLQKDLGVFTCSIQNLDT